MDIVASMMLTYSSLKFTDTLLFAMSVVACIQTSLSKFSIQKDQVPLPCIDVSCAGRCCVYPVRKDKS
jgi:hypothetical protein